MTRRSNKDNLVEHPEIDKLEKQLRKQKAQEMADEAARAHAAEVARAQEEGRDPPPPPPNPQDPAGDVNAQPKLEHLQSETMTLPMLSSWIETLSIHHHLQGMTMRSSLRSLHCTTRSNGVSADYLSASSFHSLLATKLQDEINFCEKQDLHFRQGNNESFYEALDRFKEYIRDCPNHGFNEGNLWNIFYRGIDHKYNLNLWNIVRQSLCSIPILPRSVHLQRSRSLVKPDSASPSTGDLFRARYADCHFNESVFPTLGEETKQLGKEISWNELSLFYLDPRTKECELEVQKIIHLQGLANQLPEAFADPKRVIRSHIPAENAPIRLNVPEGHNQIATESKTRQKRGRPIGSKDRNPRKRKGAEIGNSETEVTTNERSPEETLHMTEIQVPENEEISINYVMSGIKWNRKEIDVDEIFAYNVAIDIMDEDHEPTSIAECMQRIDWPKWNEAIDAEFNSLGKREVFGPVVRTPEGVKPVGHKWIFVRKRNENGEIVRHKARLVAQGFSQIPGIDYEETYSPVVDATTFRYLITLAIREGLDFRLMDVVTAYGPLDNEI
ncbi:unnamed protein product [Microthlaspi erraticum]|uniref:Uncharacterized protein n=1 Tax=Microthlaspi erraticum TaxID=1685480 RepID=A0A6D2KAD9_9BRAS|nr:unnamed protein product [Microthlaspi erraticum]